MEIAKLVQEINPELVELRRDLHRHPELGFAEHRTAGLIERYLTDLGLEGVRRVAGTGVVGLIRGAKPGKTLMLRADIDALPLQDEKECAYASGTPGCMHACGHDGHTAVLLLAAKILSQHREWIAGNVKVCFEPNEEGAGALAMIQEGVLEAPQVDACLGLHLWVPLAMGQIAVDPGPVMAGMHHFHVTITGRGGHTAMPQQAADPIMAAANFIQQTQMIQSREINPLKPTIIVFGQISGGTGSNIIPNQVTLGGTARYLYDATAGEEKPLERLERILDGVCHTCRVEGEIGYGDTHPALINHPDMAALVRERAIAVLGGAQHIQSVISMAGEDFSEFASRVPSCFYFVGAGNPAKGIVHPHHHPKFDLDEDALALGVRMHLEAVRAYFQA